MIKNKIWGLWVVLVLCACSLTQTTATTAPPVAAPTDEPGWKRLADGVELRIERIPIGYTTTSFDMVIVRIDPVKTQIRAHYTPRQWSYLTDWRTQHPEALLLVNANFFNEVGEAIGLVVVDGQAEGRSLQGFGGMLQVDPNGVRIRSLSQEPYQNESLSQAVQGFPMLVNGGNAAPTGDGFDTPARRTIAAQDTSGRVLFMVTPFGQLTLRNAQRWLLESGLGIHAAFGLDGGKSTGMYIAPNNTFYASIDPIPVVVGVYPK